MPETEPHSGLEHLGLLTPQKPPPAVPTLRAAESARNTTDVDVDQQLCGISACGDSNPDVPRPDVPLSDVVGEEWTSPRIAEEAMVVAFGLVRVLVLFVSFVLIYVSQALIITRATRGLNRSVYISFLVLWDITHAAFLQLLACKEPLCDGVEAK
jgi:hypothetical protein